MKSCTYLLPIRRNGFCAAETEEFRDYFALLQATGCEVIVVDGSPGQIFACHHDNWSEVCRHETVDPRFRYLNDKVNGVHTGLGLAGSEKIVLADDDIRYTRADIEKMCVLLEEFEVVRPQNYFALSTGDANGWIGRSAGDATKAASPPNSNNALGERVPP